jgi:prolipoprotein diacylglyceryltransferase
MIFWTYLCAYSLCRFFIQFYRQDTAFALGLSQAQLLSVLTAMVAIWALVFQYQRARRYGPSHTPAVRSRPQPTSVASPEAETEPEVHEHAPLTPS